jgi:HK97 gp10 family phage protein
VTDTVYVKGLSDLQKFLDTLPAKVERNIMRGALRAAAKDVVLPAAREGVHNVSGELAKSLRVSVRARGGEVRAAVKTDLFYARFVEYGTTRHIITSRDGKALSVGGLFFVKAVDHPGARPGPFMRPALDNNAQAALVAAGEYVKKRLATKHGLDTADIAIGGNEE